MNKSQNQDIGVNIVNGEKKLLMLRYKHKI
jgi:hypothetical protein